MKKRTFIDRTREKKRFNSYLTIFAISLMNYFCKHRFFLNIFLESITCYSIDKIQQTIVTLNLQERKLFIIDCDWPVVSLFLLKLIETWTEIKQNLKKKKQEFSEFV